MMVTIEVPQTATRITDPQLNVGERHLLLDPKSLPSGIARVLAASAKIVEEHASPDFLGFPSTRLRSSALPVPAMSKAVQWSTEVRMTGRPRVMLTPSSRPRTLMGSGPLVVVHGDNDVEVAALGEEEEGVGGERTNDVPNRERPAEESRGLE